jgi:hypothetical protein
MPQEVKKEVEKIDNSFSGKYIIVFYSDVAHVNDGGDTFGPQIGWGITEVENNETSREAALRYIKEENSTLNCGYMTASDPHGVSHHLTPVAFTEIPGPISSLGDDEIVVKFFENRRIEMAERHKNGVCPVKERKKAEVAA